MKDQPESGIDAPIYSDGAVLYRVGDIAQGVSAMIFEELTGGPDDDVEVSKANGSEGSDRERSRRIPGYGDDPFRSDYRNAADQRVLEPVNNPRLLCYLLELNSTLAQAIEAMTVNVDGFGYDLVEVVEDSSERSSLEKDMAAEKRRLRLFFDYASAELSFTQLRKRAGKDKETTGNGYWEVVRNLDGSLGGFEHLPAVTMRITPQDPDYVDTVMMVPSDDDPYGYVEQELPRRFRRFVQIIETTTGKKKVWFKEYGDPRKMDARTGKFFDEPITDGTTTSAQSLPTGRRRTTANTSEATTLAVARDADPSIESPIEASEVIHFRLDDPDSEYGVPRWMGAMLAVLGGRDADETNMNFFANGAMWDYAVMISGGHISDETVREIRELVKKKRGKDHAHKVLVIQVESAAQGSVFQFQADKSKVELVPLNHREDMMFEKYQEWCVNRIGEAFRLSPMYYGRMKDFTHANAETAKRIAEEQVFGPERAMFDEFINRFILPELGIRYHKFRSKGPTISRAEEMEKIMKTFGPYVTGREARQLFAQVTDIRLDNVDENEEIDQLWLWYPAPVALQMINLMRSMSQVPGSHAEDDVANEPPASELVDEPETEDGQPDSSDVVPDGEKKPVEKPKAQPPTQKRDMGFLGKHPALRDVKRFMDLSAQVHKIDRLHAQLARLAAQTEEDKTGDR